MLAGDVSGALSDQIGEFMRKGCWLVIGATECFSDCPGQLPGGRSDRSITSRAPPRNENLSFFGWLGK